ncbi:hypothetical Protein YC6258_00593 [Gynuella sunshinyii YC6258]|uniref:Uncharacterized protein n=1 Tax=Gynuella sunshinyii YC6258 TaxID=1445510 RepID=A0A0C5VH21_9GAMM|nr:hypothetical Protein YC6258_00593 [Gynuella sunshinyii YC6258]
MKHFRSKDTYFSAQSNNYPHRKPKDIHNFKKYFLPYFLMV